MKNKLENSWKIINVLYDDDIQGAVDMLELYMIRHGLAGTHQEDEAMDNERPLKKKERKK